MVFKGVVATVLPDSIASEIGIVTGDCLLAVNNQPVQDIIELSFLLADEDIELLIEKVNGDQEIIEIEKDYGEDLGIEFESAVFDGVKSCANSCIFCFVDQMPQGMRSSLYIKDDDYRLSFLYGNFITLTNITKKDLERITNLKLSPLYVSVHTTNAELRGKMLNNKNAPKVLKQLKELTARGIELHTQIVLCPGYNDKAELIQTINELYSLQGIISVGVVPVGLTKFRDDCPQLSAFTEQQAMEVVKEVSQLQARFRKEISSSFVYMSDEFYFMARHALPEYEWYDDFPQLENGIGIVRLFIAKWEEIAQKCDGYESPVRLDVVCGKTAAEVLSQLTQKLVVKNLQVRIIPVNNCFFGAAVTVTGLITGQDIIEALQRVVADNRTGVILPGVALRKADGKFLDNITPEYISQVIGTSVKIANSAAELRELLEGWH